MTDRVVTAKLPEGLVSQLDEIAERIERSKSWIIREAVSQWLAEEQRRYELTIEAMKAIDEGRFLTDAEVKKRLAQKKRERRTKTTS